MAVDNHEAHVDFPKIKRGKVDGAFWALYIPATMTDEEAYTYAGDLYSVVCDTLDKHSDIASLTVSEEQAYINQSKGLFSVFLGLENGSPIGRSMDRLYHFYDMGIRYITLCHSKDNEICDSCASKHGVWDGLSPFGKNLIKGMNEIGMLIDVSHISDKSFYDIMDCSSAPVVATHSCCRALASHPRNMTDEMIRVLASNGGVVQINFYPVFLESSFREEDMFVSQRPSYKLIAEHIDHVVDLVGINHVGIGSDFDGIDVTPSGMEDISMTYKIFEELKNRGYTEEDLAKIASGNFFKAFSFSGASQR